jgi:hypothetical protein
MVNRWLGIVITLLMSVSVIAQDTSCPTLQIASLSTISEFCAEQSANTLCYGSPTTSMTFTDDAEESLRFSFSGDSIPLTSIDWVSTSSEADTWGTTRAYLQAYAPNSLDVQPATMVLFGNVVLFNQGTEGITIQTADVEVTTTQGANIRQSSSAEARLLEPVMRGTTLKAIGISDDGTWVQVYVDRDEVGWVNVTAISGGFVGLPTVSPDDELPTLIAPLQAFNFQSGISDATCDGAPSSGILLQASNTDTPTEFYINGLTLQLNGTAYLQAQPEAGMLVHIIDGTGLLVSLDGEQSIDAGYMSRVFLDVDEDDNLYPIDMPTVPLVYDYQTLVNLPIDLLSKPSRVGIDIYTLITPRPIGGESPIAGMALDAPCKFTVGQSGANIRSEPSPSGSIIAVMGYRESAEPIGRTVGAGSYPWWKLADGVWIRVDTTVTGGDCASVPNIDSEG